MCLFRFTLKEAISGDHSYIWGQLIPYFWAVDLDFFKTIMRCPCDWNK